MSLEKGSKAGARVGPVVCPGEGAEEGEEVGSRIGSKRHVSRLPLSACVFHSPGADCFFFKWKLGSPSRHLVLQLKLSGHHIVDLLLEPSSRLGNRGFGREHETLVPIHRTVIVRYFSATLTRLGSR